MIRASHLAKFVKPFRYTWTHYRFEKEWKKLSRAETKYFSVFNIKTLALYFSHGKIREEEAWNILMAHPVIGDNAQRESKHAQKYNVFEQAYVDRDPNLSGDRFVGNKGIEAKEFPFKPYSLKSKPDGLVGDYVIEIKCPLGSLPKDIAINYLLQLFVEMACHNRRKAYFFQYYQPAGWYYFFQYLYNQYYNLHNLKQGDIIFRPWFDNDYTMYVIFQRVEKVLQNIQDTYDGSSETKTSRKKGLVQMFWDYCQYEERLPRPTDKDTWEDYRSVAIHLIANMTVERLIKHGFTHWESRCIMDALSMEGNDMKMGTVLSVDFKEVKILWEGDRIRHDDLPKVIDHNTGSFEETMSFKKIRQGILKIVKRMNHQISGRDEAVWKTWKQDLKQDRFVKMPPIPEVQMSLHEVEISQKDFMFVLGTLRAFLLDLKEGVYPFKKNRSVYRSGDYLVQALKQCMKRKLVQSRFDHIYKKLINF